MNTPNTPMDAEPVEVRPVPIRIGLGKRRASERKSPTDAPAEDTLHVDATVSRAANEQTAEQPARVESGDVNTSGAALLDEITDTITDFVCMEKHKSETTALWLLNSRCAKFALFSPTIHFSASGNGCGKTKALSLVSMLARNPVRASNITAAAVYRAIEDERTEDVLPTLVLDNTHLYVREDARMVAILAGSFDKDFSHSIVSRFRDGVPDGIERFSTFCPKAMAGNGALPTELMGHSIVIRLRRKPRHVPVKQVAHEKASLYRLCRQIDRWMADNESRIRAELTKLSDGRDNRVGDKWAAMLAIALVAGGDWPRRARKAMRLIERPDDDTMEAHELVLQAMQRYFREHGGNYALSKDIVAWMNADPEAPWSSYGKRGEPFSIYNLRDNMTKFRVFTTHVAPETRWRGYRLADLQAIFESYPLPDDEADDIEDCDKK